MTAPLDHVRSARAAGLRYVSDAAPGIRRIRAGDGFTYVGPGGRPIRSAGTLARIRSLAIPPAWTDVWISPSAKGHLQATGRDAKGRKQYRYHDRFRMVRDEAKYGRMAAFGRALPRLRARVSADLGRQGLPREKVLAAIVQFLDYSLVRVGNPEYARDNYSFGLTTMHNRHAKVTGARVRFKFRGKGAKQHQVDVADRRLARIVRRCQDLPGQELFQYLDHEDKPQKVTSSDVNRYLREISGRDFTAKDFRTWTGSVLALEALRELAFTSETEAKRQVKAAIAVAAEKLGNTPAICKKCYVHPGVVEAFMEGRLSKVRAQRPTAGLNDGENALAAFLRAERRRSREKPAKALTLMQALSRSVEQIAS